MQHRLYGLRGQAYVKEYKRLYVELELEIRLAFEEIYSREKRFSLLNLGEMANRFKLPVKVISEYLDGYNLLKHDAWGLAKERGCKAKDIGVVWD